LITGFSLLSFLRATPASSPDAAIDAAAMRLMPAPIFFSLLFSSLSFTLPISPL